MNTFGNARWVALAQASKIIAQLAVVFALARLMPPADYGAVAMATIVTSFAMLFRDMGVSSSIIQRPELKEITKVAAFRISLSGGLIIALSISLAAPAVAAYFRTPTLLPVLVIIATSFPLSGLVSVHQALLERNSRFKEVARIEVVSNLCGVVAALLTALMGGGVFSLAALVVVTASVNTLQLLHMVRWIPRISTRVPTSEYREVFAFSANIVGFNVVNYFARNADGIIIGRLFNPSVLGAYSLAYRMMLFPLQSLTFVATRALFPVLTQRFRENKDLSEPYLDVIQTIALLVAPLMAGLFLLRESVVPLVFGEGWGLTAALLIWFAPTGFIQSIMSVSGVVFMAVNRPRLLFRLGIFGAVLQVSAFLLGSIYGVERMAQYYLLANVVNFVPVMLLCTKAAGAPIGQVVRMMLVAVLAATIMMLCMAVSEPFVARHFALPWSALAAQVLVGMASYSLAALVLVPRLRTVVRSNFNRVTGR